MVIAAASPDLSVAAQELPSLVAPVVSTVEPAPAPSRPCTDCARCGTRLVMGYDEPECLSCGWADYSYTDTRVNPNGTSIISTATRYVLRYCGDFPRLTETLAHARVVRVRNRVVYAVNCPFCDNVMEQSSLSGKRPEAREQRYKCIDGHRVSLVPAKRGMLGWR